MIYKCMDCIHYLKCPVNAGILCDFVTDYHITYLEDHKRNHILVLHCEKFKQRDIERGPMLQLPLDEEERVCRICGKTFIKTNHDRTICSDPRCKEQSLNVREKRVKKWTRD